MKRWPEHEYVARTYPQRGPAYVARKIGKSRSAVQRYARAHDLTAKIPATRVPIADVALDAGVCSNSVRNRAIKDGVLKRHGKGRPQRLSVPREWADRLIAEKREQHEISDAGWWTIPEAEERWRVSSTTVRDVLKGKGSIALLTAPVRWRLAATTGKGRPRIVINPFDAETMRVEIEKQRRAASGMVAAKALCVELGIARRRLFHIQQELGIEGVKLITRPSLTLHFSRLDANRIREKVAHPYRRAA